MECLIVLVKRIASFSNALQLLNCRIDQLEIAVAKIHPVYENFSRSFCLERDIMNYKFRTFVNFYASIATRSDYEDFNLFWSFLFPLQWFLQTINRHAHSKLLPAPKLYNFQITSEFRYQANRFVDESLGALDRIDASFSAIDRLHNSGSLFTLLETAMDAIHLYQQQLNHTRYESKESSSWLRAFQLIKPSGDQALQLFQDHYARSDRMRNRIDTLRQIIPIYARDTMNLRAELHHLRTSFKLVASFDFATKGVVALPQAQIGDSQISWLRPDWRQEPSDTKDKSPASKPYYYDLNRVNYTDSSSFFFEITPVCEARVNREMVNGPLYMICNIWNYARMFSEIDDDLFKGIQRSWVRERLEALRRYREEIRADPEYLARLAVQVHKDYRKGRTVPKYLD